MLGARTATEGQAGGSSRRGTASPLKFGTGRPTHGGPSGCHDRGAGLSLAGLASTFEPDPAGITVAKALIITEKPSVARDIAAALGGFREDAGLLRERDLRPHLGGRPYLRAARARGDRSRVQALDARQPADHPREPSRPSPSRARPSGVRTIKKLLERNDVDTIINACDAGREGELIFREIVEHFGCRKPIRRLWLQSMTEEAIRDGFARLRPGEELENLAAAAAVRARTPTG